MAKFRRNSSVIKTRLFLESLPEKAQLEGRSASFSEAGYMANLMRAKVRVKSGAARRSIRVVPHRTRTVGAAILAGGESTTKRVRKGGGGQFDYTRGLEFGTARHWNGLTGTGGLRGALNRWKGRNIKTRRPRMHPGARAYPFFWPVYRLRKRAAKSAIAKAIGAVFK